MKIIVDLFNEEEIDCAQSNRSSDRRFDRRIRNTA